VIREGLQRAGGWEWLAETPGVETATVRARTSSGRWPDQAALAGQVGAAGAGATLRGVEAAVEGRLSRERGRLVLRVAGSEAPIALAPLERRVQRHGRRRGEARKLAAERDAYGRLGAIVENEPLLVRVLGPVVEAREGLQWLLEVREFDVAAPTPGVSASHSQPPARWRPSRITAQGSPSP